MTPRLRRRHLPLAVALLWCATVTSAHAGPLQDEIDAATPGSTVTLPAGEYAEHVTIGKDLTLRGAGAATVLRRASAPGAVLSVTAGATVTLEALTVAGDPLQPGGTGIDATDVAGLVLHGVAVTGHATGVRIADAAPPAAAVRIRASRIAQNTTAGVDSAAPVDAARTWWGCNAGPGGAGCDTVSGTVSTAPHLVLRLASQFASVPTGGAATQLVADLTRDSAGGVSGVAFPDGTPVAFAAARGSLGAPSAPTASGAAGTTLTSGAEAGDAAPSAALDGQSVTTPVAFAAPAPAQTVTQTVTATSTAPADPAPPPTTAPTGAQLLAAAREAFGARVFRLATPLTPGIAYVPRSIRSGRGTLTVPDEDVVSLLVLACPQTACDAGVSATVRRTTRSGRPAKPFALRRATFTLGAGGRRVVAVRLTPSRRRAIRAARRATMTVTIAVADATGARSKTTLRVRLAIAPRSGA